MPRVRDWQQDYIDDLEVEEEVKKYERQKEEPVEDDEDDWLWGYEDNGYEEDARCAHDRVEGMCDVRCSSCGHDCGDHNVFGLGCEYHPDNGCKCPGFNEKTTLDIMADSTKLVTELTETDKKEPT